MATIIAIEFIGTDAYFSCRKLSGFKLFSSVEIDDSKITNISDIYLNTGFCYELNATQTIVFFTLCILLCILFYFI